MAQGVPSKVNPPIVAPNGPSAKEGVIVPPTGWEQGGYDYMGYGK